MKICNDKVQYEGHSLPFVCHPFPIIYVHLHPIIFIYINFTSNYIHLYSFKSNYIRTSIYIYIHLHPFISIHIYSFIQSFIHSFIHNVVHFLLCTTRFTGHGYVCSMNIIIIFINIIVLSWWHLSLFQICPPSVKDFRTVQCEYYNKNAFAGIHYTWEAYYEGRIDYLAACSQIMRDKTYDCSIHSL